VNFLGDPVASGAGSLYLPNKPLWLERRDRVIDQSGLARYRRSDPAGQGASMGAYRHAVQGPDRSAADLDSPGQTVLISDPDGQINWPSERGLYFLDTRVVSRLDRLCQRRRWELLNGGPLTYYAARIFLTNRSIATEAGMIAPRTLGFTISRWIYGGMP